MKNLMIGALVLKLPTKLNLLAWIAISVSVFVCHKRRQASTNYEESVEYQIEIKPDKKTKKLKEKGYNHDNRMLYIRRAWNFEENGCNTKVEI
jgi:hypothetical protein